VCSRWAEGWKATSEGRRRLRKVAFDFPEELLDTGSFSMAVIPGGDEQLVVRSGTTVRTLDRDKVCILALGHDKACILALQAKKQRFISRFSTLLRYAFWLA